MDSAFPQTREYGLCDSLLKAVQEGDLEQYATKLAEFDRMTKLDDWKTTLLLRVKKMIQHVEETEDYT